MVSDQEIDKTLDWLRDSATKAAQARATRVYLEEFRKTLKATLMAENKDKPIGAQEREAYSDPRYIAHLSDIRSAVEADEKMRWLYVAAQAKIDAWRSFQANYRITGKIG